MSRRKAGNVIIKIISFLLVLALLGAGIAVIYRYIKGSGDPTGASETFYLEYDGEKLPGGESEMSFETGAEATFEVKFIDLEDGSQDYSVKVLPNEREYFQYSIGDRYYEWRPLDKTEDLSSVFGLKKEAASFTLSVPAWACVNTVLSSIYPGEEIFVSDPGVLDTMPLYRLVVSSGDQAAAYVINFSVTGERFSIELDREHIVFS